MPGLENLRIDLGEMEAIAKDVGQSSQECQSIIDTLLKAAQALVQSWNGVGKTAFETSLNKLQKDFQGVPVVLSNVSTTLHNVVEIIRAADTNRA